MRQIKYKIGILTLKIKQCIIQLFPTRLEISPCLARNSEGTTKKMLFPHSLVWTDYKSTYYR